MSVIGSNILAGASGQAGYNLTKSLRFRSSASAYLNRTPATATNRQTWTWSGWVKRGTLGSWQIFFGAWDGAGGNDTTRLDLSFEAANTISITGGVTVFRDSTQVFRDPSAWYHIVVVADTTNATAQNRLRIYVNGVEITNWNTNNTVTPNTSLAVNNNASHVIGARGNSPTQYFDGYLAEINLIDGQALTPSSFGETSSTTGVWIPKKYTGTYGTNGFYLDFEDTSSTAALGYDAAGSNDWTVNNISLTAGSTYDSMNDVPTLTSATTANYCVLNPLDKGGTVNPKNGNLGFANTAGTYNIVRSTVGITSGKWYFEYTIVNSASIGGGSTSAGLVRYDSVLAGKYLGQDTNTLGSVSSGTPSLLLYNGTNKTLSSGLNSFSVGAVIQYAYDADAGKLWVGVNNSWDGGNDPSTGSTPTLSSGFAGSSGPWFFAANGLTSPDDVAVNFGQQPFAYTPPTGFVALNTFNLPTPTIGATASTTANKYFDATLYTGNGSAATDVQTITNSGSFQPDLVWTKSRSNAVSHHIGDSVRGIDKTLFSNSTSAEGTYTYDIHAFNSNGFTVGNDGTQNTSGYTYVAWQWRASNATAVTNTAGSITSTVSANTTSGFSVFTFNSGASGTQTVGHGLGAYPGMVIFKDRGVSGYWSIWHSAFSNPAQGYMYLDLTNAVADDVNQWSNTAPTSSVFTYNSGYSFNTNRNMLAYAWAPIAGYSAFGSYTGNNASDGTFVYLGFRPKFIMIKSTSAGTEWVMVDSTRSTYNLVDTSLYANRAYSESTIGTVDDIDFLSNGFKLRNNTGYVNASQTYIYMAFAENPFKYANAR